MPEYDNINALVLEGCTLRMSCIACDTVQLDVNCFLELKINKARSVHLRCCGKLLFLAIDCIISHSACFLSGLRGKECILVMWNLTTVKLHFL
jgi:hypothetical protein